MSAKEKRDQIRKKFYIGCKVKAVIYALRFKNITEPQAGVVVDTISESEIQKGYRFGIMVKCGERTFWVLPEDVTLYEE